MISIQVKLGRLVLSHRDVGYIVIVHKADSHITGIVKYTSWTITLGFFLFYSAPYKLLFHFELDSY